MRLSQNDVGARLKSSSRSDALLGTGQAQAPAGPRLTAAYPLRGWARLKLQRGSLKQGIGQLIVEPRIWYRVITQAECI